MTNPPRRSPLRAAVTAFLGLGVLIRGILGFTHRGGGESGWFLDSVWLLFALVVLIISGGILLEYFRERHRATR